MTINEYIEGAKRTEPKTYDAYMNIAEQAPDLTLGLLLMLAGHGHAADKFKKSLIYGKAFTDASGAVISTEEVADDMEGIWDEYFDDYVDKFNEQKENLDTFDEREKLIECMETRVKEPRIARLVHSALGVFTEQAEIIQAILKYATSPEMEDLDMVNIREEIGDTLWYGAIQLDATGTDLESTSIQNNQKLRLRFPEKFTEDLAINRDVDAERTLLEGNEDIFLREKWGV